MKTDIEKLILKKIENAEEFTIDDIRREKNVSRQAVHKYVKKFLEEGRLQKIGTTRGARYLPSHKNKEVAHSIRRVYLREGLQEDEVLQSVRLGLSLQTQIGTGAFEIFSYAFTEILNNAVEHSQTNRILVEVILQAYDIVFMVRDYGVGVYAHMRDKLGLSSEAASLQELLKGKATTDPKRHTGEGLFFTSRCSDFLQISSHRLSLVFNNKTKEVFTEAVRFQKGTDVRFGISRNTKKKLAESFDEYAGEDYDYTFSKTIVRVKLYGSHQDRFVSRSIAKRILNRLDQFEEIIIDFSGVRAIGQGFADEIFRVFQNRYPNIKIKTVNASEAILAMIKHVTS